MKKHIITAVLLGLLSSGTIYASFEFRTPLSVDWRGTFHWWLTPPEEAWWYEMMPNQDKISDWQIRTWSAGYARNADKAFYDVCKNKSTTKTTSLATLIFGKEVFRGEEAFTNGTFAAANSATQLANLQILNQNNPFVGFAQITPIFEYWEYGAYWGIDAYKRFGKDDRWFAGFRADLPFKVVDVEPLDDSTEETIGDVVRFRGNQLDGANNQDFAARLDFLSTLLSGLAVGTATAVPQQAFVNYNSAAGTVTMAGQTVTGTSPSLPGDGPATYVIVSACGELPIPNPGFKKLPTQVGGPLAAAGANVVCETKCSQPSAAGAIDFMQMGTDYNDNLATDRVAQGQLFVVPQGVLNTTGTVVNLTPAASIISAAIANNFVFSMDADENASAFFDSKGIDLFAHERVTAVGDLDAEAYVAYGDYATWFTMGILGVRIPTGSEPAHANQLYLKPTGNNRHVEIKVGLDGGWKPYEWFGFELDMSVHHAFRRTEQRAAPFQGATVRNIGPEIDAKVSWTYFLWRTDLNFFHPQNPELGCSFGYELYVKSKDHVSVCQETATDLFNRPNQPIDSEIYEKRTNSLSNKIQGQFFHRWNFFEFFAGGSQIVAGRNVMKETEAHIGFVKYF